MFFEQEFPTGLSFHSMGGPVFNTTVNEGFTGEEQRNQNWRNPLWKWTIGLMTSVRDDRKQFVYLLDSFFLVVRARGDAFRFKAPQDFRVTGALIGMGDGTTTTFQLQKNYTLGGRVYSRKITKPITSAVLDWKGNALANTVTVYLDGVPATCTIDETTGIVTMASAPPDRAVVTADCQFHFPARFDADDLQRQVEESDVRGGNPIVSLNSVTLMEVRPPNY